MNFLTCSKSIKEMRRRALRGETSPWCLYAFSPLRENLFEWLEIGKKDRVLQVGSDYGSCTGLFAERAGEVVVLDPLDENLEVNRKRHGEKEKLCLVRGELPKAGTESLGWKEYKGKERAAEELDALYKDGFDYVILPSMLSGTEKNGGSRSAGQERCSCETWRKAFSGSGE